MEIRSEQEAQEAIDDAEGWLNANCPYDPQRHLTYEVEHGFGRVICQVCHYARFSEYGRVSECAIWMGRRPNDIYADIDLK